MLYGWLQRTYPALTRPHARRVPAPRLIAAYAHAPTPASHPRHHPSRPLPPGRCPASLCATAQPEPSAPVAARLLSAAHIAAGKNPIHQRDQDRQQDGGRRWQSCDSIPEEVQFLVIQSKFTFYRIQALGFRG